MFSCGYSGLVSLMISVIGGAVAWKWPKSGDAGNMLIWLLPLVAFLFFTVLDIFVASHQISKEKDDENRLRENQLLERICPLESRQTTPSVDDVRARISELINCTFRENL